MVVGLLHQQGCSLRFDTIIVSRLHFLHFAIRRYSEVHHGDLPLLPSYIPRERVSH